MTLKRKMYSEEYIEYKNILSLQIVFREAV